MTIQFGVQRNKLHFLIFLAFAIGQSYFLLLLARAMQGFASACISVCGMSLIAQVSGYKLLYLKLEMKMI